MFEHAEQVISDLQRLIRQHRRGLITNLEYAYTVALVLADAAESAPVFESLALPVGVPTR